MTKVLTLPYRFQPAEEIRHGRAGDCSIFIPEPQSFMNEVFRHLSEEDWQRVLESPERMTLAFHTLSDDQKTNLKAAPPPY
ncbi:MAG: hypothetical protein ABIV42_03250 [Nitrosospira sp.]